MVWSMPNHGIEAMLNDAKIKAAKAKDKAYRLGDSGQLYLQVTPSGGRHWRMNYTFGKNAHGKPMQKTLSFGSYPAVTLLMARKKRDEAKAVLAEGRDPALEKQAVEAAKAVEQASMFRAVAERWFELKSGWSMEKFRAAADADGSWSLRDAARWQERSHGIWSTVHSDDVWRSLVNEVFPKLGDMPIGSIKASDVLSVLQAIEARGAHETAHRVRSRISSIFIYGIATLSVCDTNPAASLEKAMVPVPKSKKQPAIVSLKDARQMLIDCEAERCRAGTKLALRLLALTAVRPGELRAARWAEFEKVSFTSEDPAPDALWRIPAARMKGDEQRKAEEGGDHLVPLAPEAVDVLRVQWRLSGAYEFVFPSDRHVHRPMSENTLRALLIRAGYHGRHVPHGFRSTFSTIMNERANVAWRAGGHEDAAPDRAIIDLMLAHIPEGLSGSEGAYNRAQYMPRRRELANEWARILLADFWPPEIHLGQPIRWAATGPGRV